MIPYDSHEQWLGQAQAIPGHTTSLPRLCLGVILLSGHVQTVRVEVGFALKQSPHSTSMTTINRQFPEPGLSGELWYPSLLSRVGKLLMTREGSHEHKVSPILR